jgi:hypothetical protein
MTGLPINIATMSLYGAGLDVLFREFRLMPSLDGYYEALTPLQSMFWGTVPMVLPLFL